ncbi:hypothetical protein ACFXKG_08580 [Streptomyces sp. NPDC059255]|uniref:hypothetical protein n=1 Tax=Streptomyces sp. NPDC059255 TaxID=3346793 RepID=UPI0036979F22
MHADIHLTTHRLRAAELHREAAEFREATGPRRDRTELRASLRTRLGWSLVELGLRLVNRPVARTRTHLA